MAQKDKGPKLEFWVRGKGLNIEISVKTLEHRGKRATVYGGSDGFPTEVEIGTFLLSQANELTSQSFPFPTSNHTHVYLMVEGAASLRSEMPKAPVLGVTAFIKTSMSQTTDTECQIEVCSDLQFCSNETIIVRNSAGVEVGRGTAVSVQGSVTSPQVYKITVPVTVYEICIRNNGNVITNFAFWRTN